MTATQPAVVWDWRIRGPEAAPGTGVHVTDLCDLPNRTRLQLLAALLDEMADAAHRHYALTFARRTRAEREVAAIDAIPTDPPRVCAQRLEELDVAVAGWRLGERTPTPTTRRRTA